MAQTTGARNTEHRAESIEHRAESIEHRAESYIEAGSLRCEIRELLRVLRLPDALVDEVSGLLHHPMRRVQPLVVRMCAGGVLYEIRQ